jgi:hypothetical protein
MITVSTLRARDWWIKAYAEETGYQPSVFLIRSPRGQGRVWRVQDARVGWVGIERMMARAPQYALPRDQD